MTTLLGKKDRILYFENSSIHLLRELWVLVPVEVLPPFARGKTFQGAQPQKACLLTWLTPLSSRGPQAPGRTALGAARSTRPFLLAESGLSTSSSLSPPSVLPYSVLLPTVSVDFVIPMLSLASGTLCPHSVEKETSIYVSCYLSGSLGKPFSTWGGRGSVDASPSQLFCAEPAPADTVVSGMLS